MTSSTDTAPQLATVLPLAQAPSLAAMPTPELRDGDWTRYGSQGVLGDQVTEQVLGTLADRALEAARSQGYATGWAQGRRAAAQAAMMAARTAEEDRLAEEVRRQAEHRNAVAALAQAAQQLTELATIVAQQLEERALGVAAELAEAIVGHALRTSPEPARDLVARALHVLPDGVPAAVRAHPSLAAGVRAELAPSGVRVVDDPALGPYDAVVETDLSVIDLNIDAALARMREALR